jgi:hypothetical protein
MQLTRFDRWLRKRFVYETHIYTMRPPEEIPAGIIAEELPDTPGRRFRHRFIARKPELADQVISFLKGNNMMFTTRVVDRSAWYVPLIAPKGKSLTYWLAWSIITTVAVFGIASGLRKLWAMPGIRDNVIDAMNVLKG